MICTYDLLSIIDPCTSVVLSLDREIICGGEVGVLLETLPPHWLYGDALGLSFRNHKVFIEVQPLPNQA